ncbi:MAG TPA: DNA oxidative demethylase AlkB [Edaphobacter sp.]|nr:DNA oxidative demethylase AlkB [Edaphobacter sp.]
MNNPTLWEEPAAPSKEHPTEGVTLLRGFCRDDAEPIYEAIRQIESVAPLRQMVVPSGHTMSVAMTNCGEFGWTTDRSGYRYTERDPLTGAAWPDMPEILQSLSIRAAAVGGFPAFRPHAGLINRYAVGARLSLHQDRNEQDYSQPIVSVSLGLTATFLLGTLLRTDTPRRIRIEHGDVLVWGGPARLIYHGVAPVRPGHHAITGASRINLTFRYVAPVR